MIINLTEDYLKAFIDYMKTHKTEADDYFLSDEALDQFDIEDNYTYLMLEANVIIGVISVMKKFGVRLRYIHVADHDVSIFQNLYNEMKRQISHFKVFLEEGSPYIELFKKQGMILERTVYALRRDQEPININQISTDYDLSPLDIEKDLQGFVDVRNQAFKDVKGSEPRDVDFYLKHLRGNEYIKEGTLLLKHNDKPVAIIKAAKEIEAGEWQLYIGPVAVIPTYQGKGLGKYMLSNIIDLANRLDCICRLSVNTDNENALNFI